MRKEKIKVIDQIEKNISQNIKGKSLIDGKYHHNSSYGKIDSILTHGILPLKKLSELGLTQIDEIALEKYNDTTSHINGIDGVSLSVVGLQDLNDEEEEYDPFYEGAVDFVIDDVKAMRISKNYGNEYVLFSNVELEKIKALDIRLLKLIEKKKEYGNVDEEFVKNIIHNYNMLIKACKKIKDRNIDIEVREMSDDSLMLDIESISKLPILTRK